MGQSNYVFKSSVPVAQLAIDMDRNGPGYPLHGEEAYFNGCHFRYADYKSLALFVYHTAMHCILRLAMMEVKSESTHEISIFWELFNEILSEIKGKNYKFNPKIHNGWWKWCKLLHYKEGLWTEFVTSKVVSGQMHYKNDVNGHH